MASIAILTRNLCSKRLWGTLTVARPLVATRCAYHQVTLRGLPFKSKEKDIEEFLQPIQPTSIEVVYSSHGRPSGKAIVTLDSEETMQEVLKKDKEYIGSRYIEVYPSDQPPPSQRGRGGYRRY